MSEPAGAIQLRAATADDVARVAACVDRAYRPYIERLGQPPGPMRDDYAEVIRAHAVTLAIVDGALAGVLVLKWRENDCLLDNVAVDPDFQGHGVGRRLIDHAESAARAAGYECIVLYTQVAMTENRVRYARLGFEVFDCVHEHGYERVYMRKHLTKSTPAQ